MNTVTIWVLLMMWNDASPAPDGVDVRTTAKYLAYHTEAECESSKKDFIVQRARALTGKQDIDEHLAKYSAGCDFVKIPIQAAKP